MTPARIAELRALVEAGTKGEWLRQVNTSGEVEIWAREGGYPLIATCHPETEDFHELPSEANAALIVAAVNELPALIGEIERLRGALESLVGGVASYSGNTIIITAGSHADAMRRMRLARQALEGGQ